jgi:parvulin-like peptidyl-prolyl isomerase
LFTLNHSFARNALEIRINGFWTVDTFHAFQQDVAAAVGQITANGRPHVVMVDVSEAVIQTQEIIILLQGLIQSEVPQPIRLAFVATTALSRMQARRLVLRENIRMFADQASAWIWLDEAAVDTSVKPNDDPLLGPHDRWVRGPF